MAMGVDVKIDVMKPTIDVNDPDGLSTNMGLIFSLGLPVGVMPVYHK